MPLLSFTGNREIMGEMVNSRLMQNAGRAIVLLVVALNAYLLIGEILGL